MKKLIFMFFGAFLLCVAVTCAAGEKKWWKKWSMFPKGNRITPEQINTLIKYGAKHIFVYCGYEGGEGDDIVCGSLIIPYTEVPPFRNGSRVRIKIPKEWWIFCYCP